MPNYRKKPVVIQAVPAQSILNVERQPGWVSEAIGRKYLRVYADHLEIDTLEGTHRAEPTDMIIRGVKGELYPCKLDIFQQTYEEVK